MATDFSLDMYVERLVQEARVFELYPDRVVVSAKWWWGRPYQTTVPLASLSPDCVYQPIRYRLFKHSILALAIGIALVLLFGRPDGTWVQQAPLSAAGRRRGAGFAAMTYQRVMFARFPPRAGRGGLDIAQSGPDRERFDSSSSWCSGRSASGQERDRVKFGCLALIGCLALRTVGVSPPVGAA